MYRKTREAGFGPRSSAALCWEHMPSPPGYYDAYYLRAQKVRSLIARDFADAFTKVDAILTPTTPTPAFKLGEKTSDPLQMYLADIYTVTGSLAGVPGMSVPCGKTAAGLPIGLQIFGPHFARGKDTPVGARVRTGGWLCDLARRAPCMKNLDPILALLSGSRSQFIATADAFPSDQWSAAPTEGKWSAGQIVVHTMQVEESIIRASKKTVTETTLSGTVSQAVPSPARARRRTRQKA